MLRADGWLTMADAIERLSDLILRIDVATPDPTEPRCASCGKTRENHGTDHAWLARRASVQKVPTDAVHERAQMKAFDLATQRTTLVKDDGHVRVVDTTRCHAPGGTCINHGACNTADRCLRLATPAAENRERWAAMGLSAGRYLDDPDERTRYLLDMLDQAEMRDAHVRRVVGARPNESTITATECAVLAITAAKREAKRESSHMPTDKTEK